MRFSSYSILSDRLPGGGYALMNGISGAVDLVSDDIGLRIAEAARTRANEGSAAWVFDHGQLKTLVGDLPRETMNDFLDRGHLTNLDPDVERAAVETIAKAVHDTQLGDPQFMIVPNLDCNYRCTYCFERPLQNKLKVAGSDINHHRGNVVMNSSHIDAIFRSIRSIQDSASRRPGGQIVLYGGEPLDVVNRDVVFEIVKRGTEAGFLFAAITNGHNLEHFTEILGSRQIAQVQISIDGPKPVHDKRRVYLGGTSSFDAIVTNVRHVVAVTDVEVQLRVHVDPSNIHLFEEVMSLFESEGWLNHGSITIYANTVYEKTREGVVSSRIDNGPIHESLQAIARQYSNVYTSAPAVHAMRALASALGVGERYQVKGTYCAANTGNYIFAPDGHIYACWESVGKACSRVGQYMDEKGLVFDQQATQKWFRRSVATIPECLSCAYALVCGGGCAQYAEYNHGDPYKPYCDDFQRVFSGALAREAESFLENALSVGPMTVVAP